MKFLITIISVIRPKNWRRVFIGAGIAGIIFSSIVVIVPFFFSEESLKAAVTQSSEAMLGQAVVVEGAAYMHMLPYPGIKLTDVSVPNPPKYPDLPPLLKADTVIIELDLLSLIIGIAKPSSIEVLKPEIFLHVTAGDVPNWGFKQADASNFKAKSPAESKRQYEQYINEMLNSMPAGILYSDIIITDGTFEYQNKARKKNFRVTGFSNTLSLDGPDNGLSLEGKGSWNNEVNEWKITFSSLRYLLNDNRVKITAKINNSLFGLNTKGFFEKDNYSGSINLAAPSISDFILWVDSDNETAPMMPTKMDINISGAKLDCTVAKCAVEGANFKFHKLSGNTSFAIGFTNPPQIDVDINANKVNLTPFFPTLFEEPVRNDIALRGELEQSAMEHFDPVLGPIFIGDDEFASVSNVYVDASAITADDTLDDTADIKAPTKWNSEVFDFSFLNYFNGSLKISAKESFNLFKFQASKAQFNAKLKNGLLYAELNSFEAYKGKGNTNFTMNTRTLPTSWQWNSNFSAVEMGGVLGDIFNIRLFNGQGTLQLNASSIGDSLNDIMKNMKASGFILINGGQIRGYNIHDMFRNIPKSFNRGKTPTEFKNLHASFEADKGIVYNADLSIKSKMLEAEGEGTVNLSEYTSNFYLKPLMISKPDGSAYNKNVQISPIFIKGDVDYPTITADAMNIVDNSVVAPEVQPQLPKREIHRNKEPALTLKDQRDNIVKQKQLEAKKQVPEKEPVHIPSMPAINTGVEKTMPTISPAAKAPVSNINDDASLTLRGRVEALRRQREAEKNP
jgi:uncharacterized protein involved in outer membrane biogenesis